MGNKPDIPRVLNQKKTKQLLEEHGWEPKLGGKHQLKMVKESNRPITLPEHRGRDYSPNLTSAILRQAGLTGPADPSGDQA